MVEKEIAETGESKPTWIKMKPAELEKKIVELAKEGKTPSQIGLILRDNHGVPKAKVMGKKITKILEENSVEYKGEKEDIERKINTLKGHLEKNKHDYSASRSLSKNLWALRRASKETA